MPRRKHPIHPAVKIALGYSAEISDKDFMKDWKERSTQVCKPCWELKYCPYGPLVEQAPLLPTTRAEAEQHHTYLQQCLEQSQTGALVELSDEIRESYEAIVRIGRRDVRRVAFLAHYNTPATDPPRDDFNVDENSLIRAIGNVTEIPMQAIGALPFPLTGYSSVSEVHLDEDDVAFIESELLRIEQALTTGFEDRRSPLTEAQRSLFESQIEAFEPNSHPRYIPPDVAETACTVFGHVCPVFFVGEAVAEGNELRRRTRHISFKTKIRVVRRDNHTCQVCGKHLLDDEVEFDHIIPISRGGSSDEHNIRLTCFDCNREKGAIVRI